ncbi:MAG TPA: diaminopimelate epimerase [Actinomycetes bacterium]|nr:diaminopimelate epimerase [Actinomycetes bacterium]
MEFVKAHGTGNDFVVVEDLVDRLEITAAQVRAICERHFGIGADGLIRICPGTAAAFFMDYRNADGSVAEMCGNGVRVVGKYLADRGLATGELDLETRAGVKHLRLHCGNDGNVDRVTVDMGPPSFDPAGVPVLAPAGATATPGAPLTADLPVDGEAVTVTALSMGNPHAVVLVDDVDAAPVTTLGPRIEAHAAFPKRANVEFVQLVDRASVRQRTWERGVGETLACGTGACAVAVACHTRGLTGPRVAVELRGGCLELEWHPGGSVRMTGPAVEVAHGTIDACLLEHAR